MGLAPQTRPRRAVIVTQIVHQSQARAKKKQKTSNLERGNAVCQVNPINQAMT